MSEYRLTRLGHLAVHLMPKFHGKKLEDAMKRIQKDGPRDKFERAAVSAANAAEYPDPKIGSNNG